MWLLLLGFLLVCFGLVVLRGAPYVPTLRAQAETALDLLDLKPGEVLVDLGSGDGVLLKLAAKRGIRAQGYELNPILCLVAYIRCWRQRELVHIHWGDFWLTPLPKKTKGVFVFSAGPFMNRLARKLAQETANKPLNIVSYGFELPGYDPVETKHGLHLYKIGQS